MPPNRQTVSFLLIDGWEPKPTPMKAKPTMGSQPKRNASESWSVDGTTDATAAPVLMVSVAVAFPLASKVTEFGLNEQVGADCAGCTEQLNSTGLSKVFWWFRVIIEVELWPRLTVPGFGAEAEIEKSAPVVLSSTLTVLSAKFVTARSGALS